ncbi:MAG TPA: CvpA family protein [Candidatus Dormibacteraeota bacterium]|nr:CvpA family protein [Candidatus Dormibacteraeota bacterium]
MIIDIIVVLVLVIALITGYQRGVIQPLLAEIFFFGTLLLVFRFHDQYTNEMQKLLHLTPVLSVFVALILAVVAGAIGGGIGGAFHRMEAIRGVDGLLGVFVHVLVTLVVVYLAVSALVVLDNAFEPAVKSASLTLTQVNQLESEILSNPITAVLVSKTDLATLKTNATKAGGARLDQVGGIHQLQQIYSDFVQPQLHGSRVVPFVLGFGHRLPLIGHVGPGDLRPLAATPNPTACPSPTPKTTPKASPSPSPKTTPSPAACATPSPTK